MARNRDPRSHPPKVPTKTQRVKTDHINRQLQSRLAGGTENPVRVSSGGQDEWPTDCPVRIDVLRVLGVWNHDEAGPSEGLMGHIIDMDFYTKQTRLEIKMYRDPNAIAVNVNGDEVFRWVEKQGDLPSGPHAIREAINAKDSAWVDQVNLQPGDEVLEDDDGTPIIVRAALDEEEDVEWE